MNSAIEISCASITGFPLMNLVSAGKRAIMLYTSFALTVHHLTEINTNDDYNNNNNIL